MTANSPTILALDFDGVVCDGLIEYFEVAWRTYCQIWSPVDDTLPDDLALRFYRLRPVIETGWEMPILIKALIAGFSDLEAKAVSTQLDNLRDEWIEKDLDGWLSLHRFYPGVIERLKITLETQVQLYIVTTKEGRFVKQLLQQEGVNLPSENIFGKEVKCPKYVTLRELIKKANTQTVNLWFVEDRLKTLQLVQQQSDLNHVKLFLADWGYNTSLEREAGKNDSRIQLISLSHFTYDFATWL